jgi:hypothetical protein
MVKMNNNKKMRMFMIGMLFLFVATSYVPTHKYYVGLTEVNINTEKHTLDVSTKLFMDDLELSLARFANKRVDLSVSENNKEVEALLISYFEKNLKINVGGKLLKLKFVGFEVENDAVWCYQEVPHFKGKGTVSVYNTLLYDYFFEQANLINVSWNGTNKSIRLSNPDKLAEFVF